MPWIIAAATLAATAYSTSQQRKAASDAQRQARDAASAAAKQAESSLQVQREQAAVAKQRLEADIAKNADEKARLEKAAKEQASTLEAERRDYAEKEAGRLRAARRSGRRSLISDVRLNPELGLGALGGDTAANTLGSTTMQ